VITQDEIQWKATEFEITPSNVQRDYVFGWLIFGIYTTSGLRNHLILKGGNALRKAYLETTRFSDDLDFTTEVSLDPATLRDELNRVCQFVQAATGVVFDLDRNQVDDGRIITGEKRVYKARLYFQDFEHHFEHITLRVNMDITENDKLYLPVQTRYLIHPYSDATECRAELRCIKLEEAMADKLKCLLQRRYSHDLYDLVRAVFASDELAVDKAEIIKVLLKKTIFEPSPVALKNLLLAVPFEVFRGYWDKRIVCPREGRIPFDMAITLFTNGLQELFAPFSYGQHAAMAFFPARLRNPILQAGSERTLLKIEYDDVLRLVEPYSLVFKRRRDGAGQEYLYVYDRTGGRGSGLGIKSLVNMKLARIENTAEKFEPRYEVELSKAGEHSRTSHFDKPFAGGRRVATRRVPRITSLPSLTYMVRCPYCDKKFRRTTFDTKLNPHKDKYGNACAGGMVSGMLETRRRSR
jgi:predicted nucleotidyltransferase component of viral defense system